MISRAKISISSRLLTRICHVSMVNEQNKSILSRNIFGQSSAIFGNLRKMLGSIRMTSGQRFENHRKSSENGRKSSENRKKISLLVLLVG